MARQHWDEKKDVEIRGHIKAGLSNAEVCAVTGCSPRRASRLRKELDWPASSRGPHEARRRDQITKAALAGRAAGISLRKLAKTHEVSETTLRRWLKNAPLTDS